jgi:hypothetical protein
VVIAQCVVSWRYAVPVTVFWSYGWPSLLTPEFFSGAPTGRISIKFGIGDFYGSLNRNLVNIGQFTWTPNYVLLLSAMLNHHKSAVFELNGIRLVG